MLFRIENFSVRSQLSAEQTINRGSAFKLAVVLWNGLFGELSLRLNVFSVNNAFEELRFRGVLLTGNLLFRRIVASVKFSFRRIVF